MRVKQISRCPNVAILASLLILSSGLAACAPPSSHENPLNGARSANEAAFGSAGAVSLANGDFENPSTKSYIYRPNDAGWTFTGNAGVQANGSAFGAAAAPSGLQTAFLQSGIGTSGAGAMSQTISIATAGDYVVSFEAALRTMQTSRSPMSFQVLLDQKVVGTFSPTATSFSSYATSAMALTAGTHTLEFLGTSASLGDTTDFVDAVTLVETSTSVSTPFVPVGGVLPTLGALDPNKIIQASTLDVYPGCEEPSSTGPTFYVDPVKGADTGDGSAAHPYKTFANVVNAGLIGYQGYTGGYTDGKALSAIAKTAKIPQGSTILLMSGDHGSAVIRGGFNSKWITVKAAPGQTPVMDSLAIVGGSRWLIQGLTFQLQQSTAASYNLGALFEANAYYGPMTDIIFEGNIMGIKGASLNWTPAQWKANAVDGIMMRDLRCGSIVRNRFEMISFAMDLYSDSLSLAAETATVGFQKALVDGNVVNYFTDDGLDYAADHALFQNNVIMNTIVSGDGMHPDAMQGQPNTGNESQLITDVEIRNNMVIRRADPSLKYSNWLQGIDSFDGIWDNVRAHDNLVITDSLHGVGYYGIQNSQLYNNTTLPDDGVVYDLTSNMLQTNPQPSATETHASKLGVAPKNIVMEYNVGGLVYDVATTNLTLLDNVGSLTTAAAAAAIYVQFDPINKKYDLHYKLGTASPYYNWGFAMP